MIMHDKAMYNNIMYEIKTVKHTRKRKMEKSNNKKKQTEINKKNQLRNAQGIRLFTNA